MSRVDFYVIAARGETARQHFACRLAEKAYRLKHTVHIRTASRQQAQQLDELLWTFRDGAFVPHELRGPADEAPPEAPITIGCDTEDGRRSELLINLSDEMPRDAEAFPRVAEIVTSDDDCRRRGRQRYADYRSQGHSLESHEV